MGLTPIKQVSQDYGISRQMLYYYEKYGLIKSERKGDYAYRLYDENAIRRLQQIIVLRKLQIPVKQISDILENQNAVETVEIFQQNIIELDETIMALSTVKSILARFIEEMQDKADIKLELDLLSSETMLTVVNALSFSENKIKENLDMADLNKATLTLTKIRNDDVRIVYLPPSAVASLHIVGNDKNGRTPEDQGEELITGLIKGLAKTKPDCRHYGFNHPVGDQHGYERWFTIPDDMEPPAPFVKKQFPGGVYGAYTLRTWDNEWELLVGWANGHEKYAFAQGSTITMMGLLEEHLNVMGQYTLPDVKHDMQVDLLVPLKEKEEWPDALGYIANSEEKCGYKASLIEKEAFTVTGYRHKPTKAVGGEAFYKKLADKGQLQQMKAALKPNAPILAYHHTDGGYKISVCADIADAADINFFQAPKMDTKPVAKKKWIQFELKMDDIKGESWDKFNPHGLVGKIGYKFDGSAGLFFVYNSGELLATNGNKNDTIYCWMPVIPNSAT